MNEGIANENFQTGVGLKKVEWFYEKGICDENVFTFNSVFCGRAVLRDRATNRPILMECQLSVGNGTWVDLNQSGDCLNYIHCFY